MQGESEIDIEIKMTDKGDLFLKFTPNLEVPPYIQKLL